MEKKIPAQLHLGDKTLLSDIIPAGTGSVGDWAYAYCSALKWLAIPDSVHTIGKEVFDHCTSLEHIFCYKGSGFDPGELPVDKDSALYQAARLNALALSCFSSPLDTFIRMGDDPDDTLRRWDEECLDHLSSPDEIGFKPFLAGGEEDYGDHDEQLKQHICARQLCKARIIYTCLFTVSAASFAISSDLSREYLDRLRTNPMAVSLLNEIDSHFTMAAEIYAKAGLLTAEAMPSILSDLKPDRIGIRSALIGYEHDTILNALTLYPTSSS